MGYGSFQTVYLAILVRKTGSKRKAQNMQYWYKLIFVYCLLLMIDFLVLGFFIYAVISSMMSDERGVPAFRFQFSMAAALFGYRVFGLSHMIIVLTHVKFASHSRTSKTERPIPESIPSSYSKTQKIEQVTAIISQSSPLSVNEAVSL